MSALRKLMLVEAKLFLREPTAVFWGVLFPAVLLVVIGTVFPGATEVSPGLGGRRLIDVYAPVALAVCLATIGLMVLPPILATYRQLGVLRRMSVTPVPPSRLLAAQLCLHLAVAVVGAAFAVTLAVVVFDVEVPGTASGFASAFLLATAALYSLGLLVGSLARTVSAGQGLGMLVYFPSLFFAGVYFPREVMPAGLRTISDLTPSGAAVQALEDAWFGAGPALPDVLVLVASTLAAGLLSARLFRWE